MASWDDTVLAWEGGSVGGDARPSSHASAGSVNLPPAPGPAFDPILALAYSEFDAAMHFMALATAARKRYDFDQQGYYLGLAEAHYSQARKYFGKECDA